MAWNHREECKQGLPRVYINAFNPSYYFFVQYYKCRWWCDGQAWHRLQEGFKQAYQESEVAIEFLPQNKVKNIVNKRGTRKKKGYISLSLTNKLENLVVAHPSLLLNPSPSMPPVQLLNIVADLSIPHGITRMSRSQLWQPSSPAGHIKLNIPSTDDPTRFKKALDKVGMRHGRIHPYRPPHILEQELKKAMGEYEGVGWLE